MTQALRDAYGDIFLIKEHPTTADKTAVEGKFKSFHNTSDNVAGLMAKTFFSLLTLADLSAKKSPMKAVTETNNAAPEKLGTSSSEGSVLGRTGLHYNIQIHLPATKDVEVYNAIFKSLREHLFSD